MGPRARTEAQSVFVNCLCDWGGGGGQRENRILFVNQNFNFNSGNN